MIDKTKIRVPTLKENAQINRAAATDPDNPPLTRIQLAKMTPASSEPGRVARLKRLAKGRNIEVPSRDKARIDADLAEHFRAKGGDWQVKLNKALRKAVGL